MSSIADTVCSLLSQIDGTMMQTICLQHGLLKTFYFNKSATQALACYHNQDDAVSARNTFNMVQFGGHDGPHCTADLLPMDAVGHIVSAAQAGAWAQLSTSASLSNVAPPPSKSRNAFSSNSGIWSAPDGM